MPRSQIRRYLKHGTLPQLAVFDAVARHGSFTRAAEELFLAQPTVSVQIRKLSDTVGLPLFEQIGKKIYLTRAGSELHAGCKAMFRALDEVEDSLANLRGLRSGRLRLAVSTTGKYFAPRLLAEFAKRNPGLDVSLQIHHRDALIERLARNEDDLYIFSNPPADQEIVTQIILPNPMVVYARADHPLAAQKNIPFGRLATEPFLIREPGSGTHMVALEAFESRGFKPNIRMELSTNEAIKQAILAGLGISIISRYTLGLDSEPKNLVVLDVEGFPIERQWQFVYPVGKQLPVVAQAFMDFVRKDSRQLVANHPA